MDCVNEAAGDSFTPASLASAFRRVGMCPIDPTRVSVEALSKGAARPVLDVDLAFFKARLIPVTHKELGALIVANGTLSTAGRPVVLTAPEILSALQTLDAEKERKAEAQKVSRQLREKRAAGLKAQRDARTVAAEQTRARKVWTAMCDDALQEAQARHLTAVSERKRANRRRAAKQRRRVQALGRPLPMREAWHLASSEADAMGLWKLTWGSPANLLL